MRRRKKKIKPNIEIKVKVPEKELWRIDEVATFFDVSEQTIRIWINEGKIKHFRVYKSIRIPRLAILECLREEDKIPEEI